MFQVIKTGEITISFLKICLGLDVGTTFKPKHSTQERQRQAALYKFKASLVYIERVPGLSETLSQKQKFVGELL